jgi:hypothetical protein
MKAKDIFGIILRTFSLYLIMWGAWQILAGVAYLPRTISTLVANNGGNMGSVFYFIYGFPAFFAGILVFLFADTLVGLTYRKPSD